MPRTIRGMDTTQKPWTLSIGFVNVGRGGAGDTERAIEIVADRMGDLPSPKALFVNEADEGNDPDEHKLWAAAFGTWSRRHFETREPFFSTGLNLLRGQTLAGAKGVPNQSPTRRISEVIAFVGDGPDVAFIGGHYPAGAHNGRRPAAAFVLLMAGYTVMLARHRKRVRHHRRAGRHVVWAMDVNWREFPLLHALERTVRRHGPDRIRVLPAKGWRADVIRDGRVALPIEALHGLEWARVRFSPRRPARDAS